jgi:hypothetical protein
MDGSASVHGSSAPGSRQGTPRVATASVGVFNEVVPGGGGNTPRAKTTFSMAGMRALAKKIILAPAGGEKAHYLSKLNLGLIKNDVAKITSAKAKLEGRSLSTRVNAALILSKYPHQATSSESSLAPQALAAEALETSAPKLTSDQYVNLAALIKVLAPATDQATDPATRLIAKAASVSQPLDAANVKPPRSFVRATVAGSGELKDKLNLVDKYLDRNDVAPEKNGINPKDRIIDQYIGVRAGEVGVVSDDEFTMLTREASNITSKNSINPSESKLAFEAARRLINRSVVLGNLLDNGQKKTAFESAVGLLKIAANEKFEGHKSHVLANHLLAMLSKEKAANEDKKLNAPFDNIELSTPTQYTDSAVTSQAAHEKKFKVGDTVSESNFSKKITAYTTGSDAIIENLNHAFAPTQDA